MRPAYCDPNISQASKSTKCESLQDSDVVDGQIILKWILREQEVRLWSKYICVRTNSSCGLLRTLRQTFVFHTVSYFGHTAPSSLCT